MILIIDGYNLLNEMYKQRLVNENQFRFFVKKISSYASIKKHEVILVFDGYNTFDIYRQDYDNVTIYFSKDISADDYIKDYLHSNKSQNIAVVTSDLEIYSVAASLGIVTIKSAAFLFLMNESIEKEINQPHKKSAIKLDGQIYKSSEEYNPELDELMAESTNIPYYKLEEDEESKKEQSSQKKLSKSERKILKIRKKL